MKRDPEVLRMLKERATGRTQPQAAARAGMSERTVRKYERLGQLPSQLKQPRGYRTRPNPFAEVWPWVVNHLERDPALQATTLFALLHQEHPGRFQAGQLRTLQTHMATWRAEHGPHQAVMFPQVHQPGLAAVQQAAVQRTIGYYRRNAPYMRYDQYLAQGWPIGTGVIEGACGHLVKDRMEQAGMRWTKPGAHAILDLRAIRLTDDWDPYWAFHRQRQHDRLYGTATPLPLPPEAQALAHDVAA